MKYLLDTNVCVHYFRGKFNLDVKFDEVGISNCAISEITLAELVFGAENSSNPEKNHTVINDFINQVSIIPMFDTIYHYGVEKARLRKLGTMISDFDLIIGCTSITRDLIMVTENLSEFQRISNIKIENWVVRN
ncbi:MAG: type II toxin-antitoxin system VapC family toxin [Spirosomaceae bacterium]|nr:type II toxin-antitoxin system VapC family toxin [Spirosomataceae bacterium]